MKTFLLFVRDRMCAAQWVAPDGAGSNHGRAVVMSNIRYRECRIAFRVTTCAVLARAGARVSPLALDPLGVWLMRRGGFDAGTFIEGASPLFTDETCLHDRRCARIIRVHFRRRALPRTIADTSVRHVELMKPR
jgi:hypothetical protein